MLYSGLYLLHQKCFRAPARVHEAESYYEKKNAGEIRNLSALIIKNHGDKSREKALRCWVKMYKHLMSQVPAELRKGLELDPKYLKLAE